MTSVPRILQNLARSPFAPAINLPDFNSAEIIRLRPMVTRAIAPYGVTLSSPAWDIVKALTDFVARTASYNNPLNSKTDVNLTVTSPAFASRAAYNTWLGVTPSVHNDYWIAAGSTDGLTQLDKLYGTFQVNGTNAADGLLTEYAPGQWRINSSATWHPSACSYLVRKLMYLLAAAKIPYIQVSCDAHDGGAMFDSVRNQWVWICPSFDEYYLDPSGQPASPAVMQAASLAGTWLTLPRVGLPGPTHDPAGLNTDSGGAGYLRDSVARLRGVRVMGSMLGVTPARSNVGDLGRTTLYSGDLADGSAASVGLATGWTQTTLDGMYPQLGVLITGVNVRGGLVNVRLDMQMSKASTGVVYQRRIGAGPWLTLPSAGDTVAVGAGTVEYRVLDAAGFSGASALISV